MLKPGQTVYVVRDDNVIDEWRHEFTAETRTGEKCVLSRGNQNCIIPIRCVFETYEKALEVAQMGD